ncbi:MAG: ATP synthase F1 subunit epsilon [Parcubacteria group bacterium]
MPELRLRIVTIAKVVIDGPASMVNVTTPDGQVGVLPGHIPLLSVVSPGLLRYKTKTREYRLVCSSGSIEVKANKVTILVGEAVPVESIDVHRAEAERERLINLLKHGELPMLELKEARAQLDHVLAKLRARTY